MIRAGLLVAALASALLLPAASPSGASAKGDPAWIEGGDLPHRIYLSWSDYTRLMNSYVAPAVLDAEPPAPGARYSVGNVGWTLARRAGFEGGADDLASYYPEVNAVVVRLTDGTSAWLALDEQRAALLAFYRDLGRTGRLPEGTPSELQLRLVRSEISAELPRLVVDGAEGDARDLWRALARHGWPLEWARRDLDPGLWQHYEEAWWDEPGSGRVVRLKLTEPDGQGEALDYVYLPELRKLVVAGYLFTSPSMPVHAVPPDVAAELDELIRPERRSAAEQASAVGAFALVGGLALLALVGTLAGARSERGERDA